MPSEHQPTGNGGQYQSEKRRLASQKNVETIKALLRGCRSEAELREWIGAMNAVDCPTECKRYAAALIRKRHTE